MLMIITRWLIITVAILLASKFVPGIHVENLSTAVIAACVLGLINVFIRPIFVVLTLPLSILTLGLFYFCINALMLMLAAYVVSGFEVKSFFAAFFGSLIISLVSWLANSFISTHKIVKTDDPDYIDLKKGGDGKWR
ncbi:MAG TPA: phage holin family protein [Smithella sp.]|nr:phage holin family protein [Smithella sp.]HOG89961.1 phage holin family protein [Smithella sp.]